MALPPTEQEINQDLPGVTVLTGAGPVPLGTWIAWRRQRGLPTGLEVDFGFDAFTSQPARWGALIEFLQNAQANGLVVRASSLDPGDTPLGDPPPRDGEGEPEARD